MLLNLPHFQESCRPQFELNCLPCCVQCILPFKTGCESMFGRTLPPLFVDFDDCLPAMQSGLIVPMLTIWDQIHRLLSLADSSQILITKVQAHRNLSSAASPLEEWCFLHNSVADKHAVAAALRRPVEFWKLFTRHPQAVQFSESTVLPAVSKAVVHLATSSPAIPVSLPAGVSQQMPGGTVWVNCSCPQQQFGGTEIPWCASSSAGFGVFFFKVQRN